MTKILTEVTPNACRGFVKTPRESGNGATGGIPIQNTTIVVNAKKLLGRGLGGTQAEGLPPTTLEERTPDAGDSNHGTSVRAGGLNRANVGKGIPVTTGALNRVNVSSSKGGTMNKSDGNVSDRLLERQTIRKSTRPTRVVPPPPKNRETGGNIFAKLTPKRRSTPPETAVPSYRTKRPRLQYPRNDTWHPHHRGEAAPKSTSNWNIPQPQSTATNTQKDWKICRSTNSEFLQESALKKGTLRTRPIKTRLEFNLPTVLHAPYTLLMCDAYNAIEYETMVVQRNGMKIRRWENAQVPKYFKMVESDVGIMKSVSLNSLFQKYTAERSSPVRQILEHCQLVRDRANRAVRSSSANAANLWPVDKGNISDVNTCLDSTTLKEVSHTAINYGNYRVTRSSGQLQRVVQLHEMVEAFQLDKEARDRVFEKRRSLLAEAAEVCARWEASRHNLYVPKDVPPAFVRSTKVIHRDEPYFQCKYGVYFMPKRKSVIKFLTNKLSYPDFVWEAAFGLSIKKVKGVVSVCRVCPEAFCIEMNFAGLSLDDVLNGDCIGLENRQTPPQDHPPVIQRRIKSFPRITCLYAVRMMSECGLLKRSTLNLPANEILDTYHAMLVAGQLRLKVLDNLPFLMAEMANIVTRLAQQEIVNPDIKCDNFVLDPVDGQPLMIDLGLVVPEGTREGSRNIECPERHPQSPPEYLRGDICTSSAMVFGLAFTFKDMLTILLTRTGDPGAAAIHNSIHFLRWLSYAYSVDPHDRPDAASVAKIIGACFPFPPGVADLFNKQKQVIY